MKIGRTELERLKDERRCDTEWLGKYKKIIDGLQQMAEIQADGCGNDFDEWAALSSGLASLSRLIQEDIDGRKEEING